MGIVRVNVGSTEWSTVGQLCLTAGVRVYVTEGQFWVEFYSTPGGLWGNGVSLVGELRVKCRSTAG